MANWGTAVYGTGQTEPRRRSSAASTESDIKAIAAGSHYGLALDVDGYVWAWGGDASGQLGSLAAIYSMWRQRFWCRLVFHDTGPGTWLPRRVPIAAIAAGGDHSLALDADGQVWAWGNDSVRSIGHTDLQ